MPVQTRDPLKATTERKEEAVINVNPVDSEEEDRNL